VDAVLDELLALAEELAGEEGHGGGPIAHLGVLRLRDVH